MEYQELETRVLDWADDKGILEKATPYAQAKKTFEEVEELSDTNRGSGGFGSSGK